MLTWTLGKRPSRNWKTALRMKAARVREKLIPYRMAQQGQQASANSDSNREGTA